MTHLSPKVNQVVIYEGRKWVVSSVDGDTAQIQPVGFERIDVMVQELVACGQEIQYLVASFPAKEGWHIGRDRADFPNLEPLSEKREPFSLSEIGYKLRESFLEGEVVTQEEFARIIQIISAAQAYIVYAFGYEESDYVGWEHIARFSIAIANEHNREVIGIHE